MTKSAAWIRHYWILIDFVKAPSIDKFYASIDRHILLVRSYLELPEISFIIKACRLKPYDYVLKGSRRVVLYRQWIDEFGNSLFFNKQKEIEIVYNDISLDKEKITSTDLYYGLSLDRVVKMSKLLYLCSGKDEDKYQDCFLLSFLGLDNYLRSYLYLYGDWQQVSPLLLGPNNLKIIAKNCDAQYFRQFDIKENMPVPCVSSQQWLSSMPLSNTFVKTLTKQYEILSPIFES